MAKPEITGAKQSTTDVDRQVRNETVRILHLIIGRKGGPMTVAEFQGGERSLSAQDIFKRALDDVLGDPFITSLSVPVSPEAKEGEDGPSQPRYFRHFLTARGGDYLRSKKAFIQTGIHGCESQLDEPAMVYAALPTDTIEEVKFGRMPESIQERLVLGAKTKKPQTLVWDELPEHACETLLYGGVVAIKGVLICRYRKRLAELTSAK